MTVAMIINRNRLTLTRRLADWCVEHGLRVVILDNDSDYPPLMDYYCRCGHTVLYFRENYGHTLVWDRGVLNILDIQERYIVTDPDLDMSGVPDDFMDVLNEGLNRYPRYDKCGVSLEIGDLPDTKEGRIVPQMEARYWRNPLDPLYFGAPIDTTFALYHPHIRRHTHSAVRVNRPYTARHLPWYYDRFEDLPEDEQYYFQTADGNCTGKQRLFQ